MDNRRLMDEMECCRSDEDLNSPDMADLAQRLSVDPLARARWNRLRTVDRAIGQKMTSLEVPAGLADRILARIDSAAAALQEPTISPEDSAVRPEPVQPVAPRAGRRRWLAGVAALAASVVVCAGLWSYWDSTRTVALNPNNLPSEAARWFDEVSGRPWETTSLATSEFPPANLRANVRITGWTAAEEVVDHPAVGYRLTAPDGSQAVLFVSRASAEGIEGVPPVEPNSSTMGKAVAFWQSSDLLYVLVMEDGNRYSDFINPALPPIT